jgi:uncharacterized protein (TIGR00255 family)
MNAMWMSMTGFGRGESHGDEVSVTADIRSVNHRFLDIHVRCPVRYLSWEMPIRSFVRDALKRGKADVYVNVREWGRPGTSARINRELLMSLLSEAASIQQESGLRMDMTFGDLLAVPDLFMYATEADDLAEKYRPFAEKAVHDALAMLLAARRDEGERLRAVVRDAVSGLRAIAEEIASLAETNKAAALERFKERITIISGEAGVDPNRMLQEAAILLDRLDITEECDRMRSHIAGLEILLSRSGEAVGKRFDFLVQEVFRELSTAASKSGHAGISERAVTAKAELEKIREQIQNVE